VGEMAHEKSDSECPKLGVRLTYPEEGLETLGPEHASDRPTTTEGKQVQRRGEAAKRHGRYSAFSQPPHFFRRELRHSCPSGGGDGGES